MSAVRKNLDDEKSTFKSDPSHNVTENSDKTLQIKESSGNQHQQQPSVKTPENLAPETKSCEIVPERTGEPVVVEGLTRVSDPENDDVEAGDQRSPTLELVHNEKVHEVNPYKSTHPGLEAELQSIRGNAYVTVVIVDGVGLYEPTEASNEELRRIFTQGIRSKTKLEERGNETENPKEILSDVDEGSTSLLSDDDLDDIPSLEDVCDDRKIKVDEELGELLKNLMKNLPPEKGEFTSTKRGVNGLSPLPFRLNTLERMKRDSELRRVFRGKHENNYKFVPNAEKTTGCAIGTIYVKEHSCGKKDEKTRKKWLGKVGINDNKRYGTHTTDLDSNIKNERGYNLSVMIEYIANCLYRVFGDGYFETPKNRLARLPLIEEFKRCNEGIIKKYRYADFFQLTHTLRVMSKWCEDYRDFESVKVKTPEEKVIPFMEFIRKFRTIPEKVLEPESGREVRLKGMLALLATSTSLGDPDCIGISGNNCGFVAEYNDVKEIISFNVVKVDPGFAFSYQFVRGEKCGFQDPRDLRYCLNDRIGIKWKKLTKQQKHEFLEVKIHHFEIAKSREILEFIFLRDGIFNDGNAALKMTGMIANDLITELIGHITKEEKLYENEIFEYRKVRENVLKSNAQSDKSSGDYDRSLCKYEKVLELIISETGVEKNNDDIEISTTILQGISDVLLDIAWIEQLRGYFNRSLCFAERSEIILVKIPDSDKFRVYERIGGINCQLGNYEKAIEYYERCNEIRTTASSFGNLGNVFHKQGKYSRAIENFEKDLDIKLKSSHPDIASTYNNLGSVYFDQGEYGRSFENFKRALEIREKSLPENHPDIASSYGNLGGVFSVQGDHEKAIENHEIALEIRLKALPENHPDIASTYGNLGIVYYDQGKYEMAIKNHEKDVEIKLKSLPENHPDIASSYNNLGSVYYHQRKNDRALENFKKALKIRLKSLLENHPSIASSYANLGTVHYEMCEYEESAKNFELSYKIHVGIYGKDHKKSVSDLKKLQMAKGKMVKHD